jgi:hypothetical protein
MQIESKSYRSFQKQKGLYMCKKDHEGNILGFNQIQNKLKVNY